MCPCRRNVDLQEKDLNLDVVLRLGTLLANAGYRAVFTRNGDYILVEQDADARGTNLRDLQARIDGANTEQADILVSVHFNGLNDTSQSGTEVYYNPDRDFGEKSRALAIFVHDAMVNQMSRLGYAARDRGVKNDAEVGGDQSRAHSILLGDNPGFRASQMPGIIGEALFMTNDADATFLRRDDARQAIAQAYFTGIEQYFKWLVGG